MSKTLALKSKTTLELLPTPPFNFDATLHKPSHFPSSDNLYENGIYWQTMFWKDDYLGLKFENTGTVERPRIRLTIFSQKPLSRNFLDSLIPELEWRYNLKSDISEFVEKFKKEIILGSVIKKWGGMKPVAANSFYETLVIYIVLQNAPVRRTVQMFEALFDNFGKKLKFNGKTLSAFWPPSAITKVSEERLRELKLGYRAKFLKKLSEQFSKGEIDEFKMRGISKDEVKRHALKLYGIGPASVEYLLFEDFYHYDDLGTIPPWEQKILSRLLFKKVLVPAKQILDYAEKHWGKWKKLAVHYLWEDLFWQHKKKKVDWLEKEIRL